MPLSGPLLVRSPNWLGDAVMAFPAVRNLKSMLGRESLTVAAPEKIAPLWEACSFVDQVIALKKPRNLLATARQLRAGNFQTAVLLPNSLRVAVEAQIAGIPHRIGYNTRYRFPFLTQKVPLPGFQATRFHHSYYFLELVQALGGPDDLTLPVLRRAKFQNGSAKKKARPILALCPGAEYGAAKRWPIENFAVVARYFIQKHKFNVVLLGAAGDAAVAAPLIAEVPQALNRLGQTTLPGFMEALAGARLVLCHDSGAMHVAAALGAPTVALFGSTEPRWTGPMNPETRVLRHHVPCSPCFLRTCPLDFACMTSLTPERVIAELETLL